MQMDTKLIGNKIAQARKTMNISQAQLSEKLFVTPQAVGRWERGESMPDITTFNRLAKILGVDLNFFSVDFASNTKADLVTAPVDETTTAKTESKPQWNMSSWEWVDADFSGLKNLHEKFSNCNMQQCQFIDSDLSGLLLKNNNVKTCDFRGSSINKSTFRHSNLMDNRFNDCKLSGSEFSDCHIQNCDFSGAEFDKTLISGSNLSGNAFTGCSLKEAECSKSTFSGCDFSGADFTQTTIKSGGMEKIKTENATWNCTTFINTFLGEVVFEGEVKDCYFENCAFSKVTFQNTRLINTCFKSRKLKRISFIDCQVDRITYEFLKAGKADMSGITLINN